MRFQRARCCTIGAFHLSDAAVQKLLEFDGKVYKGPPIHPTAIAPTESPIRA